MGAKEQLEAMQSGDPARYSSRAMTREAWEALMVNPNARKWKYERIGVKPRVQSIALQMEKQTRPGREWKIEHYEGMWWVIKTNFPFPYRVWGI